MSLVNILYLSMVVCAFVGYGLVLFFAWLFTEVLGSRKPEPVAEPTHKPAARFKSAA